MYFPFGCSFLLINRLLQEIVRTRNASRIHVESGERMCLNGERSGLTLDPQALSA